MALSKIGSAAVEGGPTEYLQLPVGTTAQRPASPVNGMTRYNTTNGENESYVNGSWQALSSQAPGIYSTEYLIVAGGGSGGQQLGTGTYASAGGGAGGLLSGVLVLNVGTSYPLVVGAGGASPGFAGNNSTGLNTAIGGGSGSPNNGASTRNGGSGGGAGDPPGTDSQPAGSGTTGQGFAGGAAPGGQGTSGGGGGATAVGSGNQGGAGLNWQALGTFYAGGGSGGGSGVVAGGAGGGGTGGPFANSTTGGANTGGGGGGSYGGTGGGQNGKTGGSGIAIIRYLGGTRGTGGTITSVGGYTYHTFTSSGTYTA